MSLYALDTENRRIEKAKLLAIKRGDNPSVYEASHMKTCFRNDGVADINDFIALNPVYDP